MNFKVNFMKYFDDSIESKLKKYDDFINSICKKVKHKIRIKLNKNFILILNSKK